MPCRGRRRPAGAAQKFTVQQANPANRGPVGDGELVHGVPVRHPVCDLYGYVHQVLRRAHAQFEPEETTGPADHRHAAKADEHPEANGECDIVHSIPNCGMWVVTHEGS